MKLKQAQPVLIPTAVTDTLIFADYEGTGLNNVDAVTFTADKAGIIPVPSDTTSPAE